MIFASFEFLFLFLPVFFAVYFLTPFRWRNWPILILSWAFYAWWRVDFLALLVAVTVLTFLVALRVDGARHRGAWLALGVAGNLGVLAYFKYANFGVETFNALGWGTIRWAEIVLPIGLSFYALQSVSYLVDVYRRDVPVSRSFVNYAAYKAIFAQLIAGPIVRYAEIEQELKSREHSLVLFGAGARRFMAGFAMKVVIADTLAPLVDAAFALPAPSGGDAWTAALAYTLQLFFDFAGYSAMAIGLAMMMGFHFPENFANPYLSASIQEFWQRWHMTLSRFLRDYLYVPLGGNRRGAARTYCNLLATMVIGGLWYGASWTVIVWGCWHGALLALHRLWSRGGRALPAGLGLPLTFLAVLLGWVVFRAHDLGSAWRLYAAMAGGHGWGISDGLAWQILPEQWWVLVLGLVLCALPAFGAWLPWQRDPQAIRGMWRLGWQIGPSVTFVLALVLLYSRAAVPFLYFQF